MCTAVIGAVTVSVQLGGEARAAGSGTVSPTTVAPGDNGTTNVRVSWSGMAAGQPIFIQVCDNRKAFDPGTFNLMNDCLSTTLPFTVQASHNPSGSGSTDGSPTNPDFPFPGTNLQGGGWSCSTAGTPTGTVDAMSGNLVYNPCLIRVTDSFPANGANELYLPVHIGADATLTADTPAPVIALGLPFSYTFIATGFPAPTFTVTSGILPAGLSLHAVTGVLSGIPTVPGRSTFTVSASNAVTRAANSPPLTMTVAPAAPPSFTRQTPPVTMTAGTSYSYTFAADGSPSPTFTVTSGTAPVGLSLNAATGVLSGAPTVTGTSTFTVSAANGRGSPAVTPPISVRVSPPIVFTAAAPPASATVGTPFTYTFAAAGLPPPTYVVASGALPPGLGLDPATGVLSGAPSSFGQFSFSVTASNGAANPLTTPMLAIDVLAAPVFTASSPPTPATVDAAYGYTFAATGDPAPNFAVTSGSPPPGLNLDAATGSLSGFPASAGTFAFTVSASNGIGAPASAPVTLAVVASNPVMRLSASAVTFPAQVVGTTSGTFPLLATVMGGSTVNIGTVTVKGPNAGDFAVSANTCAGATLMPSNPSCSLAVAFSPVGKGFRSASLIFGDSAGTQVVVLAGMGTEVGLNQSVLDFGNQAVGSTSVPSPLTFSNTSTSAVGPLTVTVTGANPGDFVLGDRCSGVTVATGEACSISIRFAPGEEGLRRAVLSVADGAPSGGQGGPHTAVLTGRGVRSTGYWLVASDGGVFSFGSARFLGSTGSLKLNSPIVGMTATPDGLGYWLVASDGGVFGFGSAQFFGSASSPPPRNPIAGMAAAPDGLGYSLATADASAFAFGSTKLSPPTSTPTARRPIVGIAAAADGLGYWLVGSDGGIFAFGSAQFLGSTGSIRLGKPIVGIAPAADGLGYWLVGSDGGIFAFGSAQFLGSMGSLVLNRPVVGMARQ